MGRFAAAGILRNPICPAYSLGRRTFFRERREVNEDDCSDSCRFYETAAHTLFLYSFSDSRNGGYPICVLLPTLSKYR